MLIAKTNYFSTIDYCSYRAFGLCIDSNETTTFKAQKGSKDIIKIVHVTSVVQQ